MGGAVGGAVGGVGVVLPVWLRVRVGQYCGQGAVMIAAAAADPTAAAAA